MKPETAEWVAKAEGDWHTAQREIQATEYPNYDGICFHAQQCVEKYLKARLIEAAIPFPKVHDLGVLLQLILPLEPAWAEMQEAVLLLTDMGVEVRYPGVSADLEDAQEAVRSAGMVRSAARRAMGLD